MGPSIRERIHQYCNSPWVARVESPSSSLFFIAMFMHRGLKRRPHDDRTCHDSYGTFWLMFPRDNEAAWINRPGNGMHLRGKSRDRERELTFKTFNSMFFEKRKRKKNKEGKGYRKIFEKKSCRDQWWICWRNFGVNYSSRNYVRDRNIFDHTRDCSNIYIIFSFPFGVEMINNGVSTFDVERITNFSLNLETN